MLITSCGGLGDLIVCTPALKRLKEKFKCHITFLCQEKYKDVLLGLEGADIFLDYLSDQSKSMSVLYRTQIS